MEINGKIYRNLEGQVQYLTEKWDELQDQINDVKGKLTHYIVVEELPTEDIDTSAVYLVGPKGTEPNTYYEEWVYVETSEGTWSWEKLGDTASVDLSGYLEKDETVTTYPQVYGKDVDGTQSMVEYSSTVRNAALVQRNGSGQILCADPTADSQAVNRGFANQTYRGKLTSVTEKDQAYVKFANGTQGASDIDLAATGYTIAKRYSNGTLAVAYAGSTDPDNRATNIGYCNDHYLAKNTATSSYFQTYCKNTDGTQAMCNANVGVVGGALPLRRSNGNLAVPLTPTEAGDAASKSYVDAVVGQLLYLHEIELSFASVSGDDDLTVLAYLINDDPTAIEDPTYDDYSRMTPSHGQLGVDPVAITKLPPSFRQDHLDQPRYNGFMYQYFSGGNLVSGKVDSNTYTMTVTDVVINF